MFLKRSYCPEIMDDFSIQDERIDAALDELKNANRFLGGISTTRRGMKLLLKRETRGPGPAREISILDVGSGASDNLISLKSRFPFIRITSIDLNKRACKYLKSSTGLNVVCADTLTIPVKAGQFDIVHSSLFLHHFSGEEIGQILKTFIEVSRKGIVINDLRRSVLALAGIKIVATLFSRSELFKNDGPLSVKRGFVKKELIEIMNLAGINNFTLKRKWAFRWMLVIYINNE